MANGKNRVLRSTSSSYAPAGRAKDTSARKEYVRAKSSAALSANQNGSSTVFDRFHKVMAWSNTRKVPLINFLIIVVFLVFMLSTSLMLRTQMAELSFEQAATQSRISRLHQDVETRQAQLDTLEAELPAKAQQMGMVPQQGSIAIDLSDYAAKRQHHNKNQNQQNKQNQQQNQQQQNQNQQQQQQNQQNQNQQQAKQEKH